ncbi:MAG TPA: hypothetical protein VGQ39_19805 [Pyrinomonadaceae bacterium]|jgi:hypothetical protein|nr:hypothetical protein [Pyrinomonadaceae bacterium]
MIGQNMAEVHAALGEKDQALAALERANVGNGWFLSTLNADPMFDYLRSDPRYIELVRRMGLEP